MMDVIGGSSVDDRKRTSKGRGRGISSLRSTKDADTKVGAAPSTKEKEVKSSTEETIKDESKSPSEENFKRGTKVRKTKAGYEPYQVKKNRPLNASSSSDMNKSHFSGEREHKQESKQEHKQDYKQEYKQEHKQDYKYEHKQEYKQDYKQDYKQELKQSQSPSQKRSSNTWKYDHKSNEKYYDKSYEQKSQSNYDQKNQSQNKIRTNNKRNNNNYRGSYTNKEKQKQSRRKKSGGNENYTPTNDRINNRKNIMHDNSEVSSLHDRTNMNVKRNEQSYTGYDKDDVNKYENYDADLKDIPENVTTIINNEYIEFDQEVKSLKTSNSESESVRTKVLDNENKSSLKFGCENGGIDRNIGNYEGEGEQGVQEILADTADNTDSPSEVETVEENPLTAEENNILKEVDRKRRIQGIGILECPCSLGLDGERVGFCDAHELIEDHRRSTYSTVNCPSPSTATNEIPNSTSQSKQCSNFPMDSVDIIDDPIDEIYLTVSPIHVDTEQESNCSDIDEDLSKNNNFLSDLSDGVADNADIDSCIVDGYNVTGYNKTTDCFDNTNGYNNKDGFNDTEGFNVADVFNDGVEYNERDVYNAGFPSPITLETSRNIDIENINALFMNLGRRQSENSFNSSSYDSKINSSCERSWRSVDDFSMVDLQETHAKSPSTISIISVSSDSSVEPASGDKREDVQPPPTCDSFKHSVLEKLLSQTNTPSVVQPVNTSSSEVSDSTAYLKSDTSSCEYSKVSSFKHYNSSSDTPDVINVDEVIECTAYDVENGKYEGEKYNSKKNESCVAPEGRSLYVEDAEVTTKTDITPSLNSKIRKIQDENTQIKNRSLVSILSILNENKNLDDQSKQKKKNLVHSYSEDNKNNSHMHCEEKGRPRTYSEGRNDRCRISPDKVNANKSTDNLYTTAKVKNSSKERLDTMESVYKKKIYTIETVHQEKTQHTKRTEENTNKQNEWNEEKSRRKQQKLTGRISNDSSKSSGGSVGDVAENIDLVNERKKRSEVKETNIKRRQRTRTISNGSSNSSDESISDLKDTPNINNTNQSDNQGSNNDLSTKNNDSKTAGVIVLPNSDYIAKSQESTPEKQDRSFDLSTAGVRRHVRFSSGAAASRFSTATSTKHDDDSYMVREYMSTIKDKQFQLQKLLQRGFQSLESVHVMLEMSEAIQQKFGELIVHNQEYSFRHNFENFLWKLAFHNIITKFRTFLEDQDVPLAAIQKIGVLYWDFLQNGIQFLDSIIVQLQKQAHFDLNHYLEDPIQIANCNKQVKYALRSCHLLLIFMGDLERYVSQLQQEETYSNAKKYYKQAQILTPKNGKSYNQLAVVAVVTKHKLDAVYYYARSLQVSIPFLTAKDRLTAIFQEIQKKATKLKHTRNVSYVEAVKPTGHVPRQQESNCTNVDHLRDEVWIFYRNGQMSKVMLTEDNEVIDLTPTVPMKEETLQMEVKHSKLSLKEINRGYMILFLFVHCKLYTNIGLEEFTFVHQETLSDLTTLLRYPKSSSIRKENLLKCIVINIFSVHNIMEKNGHEDVIPNTALDLAIIFGMDMVGVLCKHCVHLFKTKNGLSVGDQFLPAIRVWIQWLITHSELVRKSTVSAMFDIWLDICGFFNAIRSLPCNKDMTYNSDGNAHVYLEEDLLLAGLKSLSNTLTYCSPPSGEEESVISQLRVENILELIKRLDECGNLPLAIDGKENKYKPVLSKIASSSPVKKAKVVDVEDEIEAIADVIIEDDDEDDLGELTDLKAQKAALTKQIQENEVSRHAALAVLESHRLQGHHLSENSPTYLVADTNCYIDHLSYILTILKSKDFTLVVPLVVINELDGLKKGSYFDENKFQEHQKNIQEFARMAVNFLEDQFSQSNTNIRAITSSGTEMDTIVFRVEEFSNDRGTNDDVILSCCLHYCKEHKVRTEDSANAISREVVLLTNDRNLRLKAHSRFVPTVDIPTFMRMAKFS